MSRTPVTFLLVLGLLVPGAACTLELGQGSANSEHGDDVGGAGEGEEDECKIEGSAIGTEGVELSADGVIVTFTDWVAKEGEPGEYVGFTISTSDGAPIDYLVKTGGEVYASSDTTWTHPNGIAGPEVPAISNVDVPCDDPDGDGGDEGDDGSDCTDPDGCDGGDGSTGDDDGGTDDGGTDDGGTDGGDECVEDADCPTGEFCGGGTCTTVIE